MKIDTESAHLCASQRAQTSAEENAGAVSFSSALAAAAAETSTVKQPDFSGMTRQEMFDWMNDQIRSGKMSLEESAPFLGMTVKISVATGQPVDMATDTTRIDFVEKARQGIEEAISRNDRDLAGRLRMAMEIMQSQRG